MYRRDEREDRSARQDDRASVVIRTERARGPCRRGLPPRGPRRSRTLNSVPSTSTVPAAVMTRKGDPFFRTLKKASPVSRTVAVLPRGHGRNQHLGRVVQDHITAVGEA